MKLAHVIGKNLYFLGSSISKAVLWHSIWSGVSLAYLHYHPSFS